MSLQRLRILPVRAFCKPDHGYLLELYFPALAGRYQSQSGEVPDTANPSMPIQICPAPPPLFRRIGLAIGLLGADGADGRHPITGMHG